MSFQFIRFDETPKEKYLGVATVKVDDKYLVRLLVRKNPKGGYFIAPPSVKMDSEEGDVYAESFMMDSNFQKEELHTLIRSNIRGFIGGGSAPAPQPVPQQQAAPSALTDADLPF